MRYVAGGLIGAALIATGLTLWALRNDAIAAAEKDADNVASILAEQITRSVQGIDAILDQFSNRATAAGIVSPDQFRQGFGTQPVFDIMRDRLAHLPEADFITVYDSAGQALNSSRRQVTAAMNFSDRDYFRYLSTHDAGEIYVTGPVTGRVSGTQLIIFSRRINGAFGEFVGGVSIGIEVKHLQRSYDSIGALASQTFLFTRRDGTILLRYPDPDFRAGQVLPPESPWHEVVAHGGGFYRSPGYFQDEARLVAVHPLRGHPLVANVGVLESAALATWQRRATLIGLGTLLAAMCAAFLLRALATRTREIESVNLHLDAALNNMSQGLVMCDRDQRLLVFNAHFIEMYGLAGSAVARGCTLVELLQARAATGTFSGDPVAFAAALGAQIADGKDNRFTADLADGRLVAVSNHPLSNGGWVSTHEDITERRRSEQRIAHMAHYDALTDLPNRILFRDRMDAAIVGLRQSGQGFAVFIFDLDLFKSVNDALGHPVGDALLKAIAVRLQGCSDGRHTVGRIGGDEFAVIQTASGDQRQAAIDLADKLLQVICAPYDIDGHAVVIGISIGIALAPEHGEEAGALLKNADLALYRAKSDGRRGCCFFEPDMDRDAELQRALEIDLRNALARDEFEIHYQVVIDIASQQPCGAEALVRWRHPRRGLLGPDRFIAIAENIGLIIPLGEWILRRACRDAAAWPDRIRLAVNLSPVQFRSPRLVEVVGEALAESGLAAERLELEITESVLLQKDAGNLRTLERLGALGASIVLDDFGTGYSSLGYLRMYRFGRIKIDKSFVAEMTQRSDCAAIICALANLAQSLGIGTTAEGIETWEQFDLVRAAGCGQAQGFLFSRPGPVGELDFAARRREPPGERAA